MFFILEKLFVRKINEQKEYYIKFVIKDYTKVQNKKVQEDHNIDVVKQYS